MTYLSSEGENGQDGRREVDRPGCEEFALRNDPPRRPKLASVAEPMRQRVLIDGLDLLPGQQDLF